MIKNNCPFCKDNFFPYHTQIGLDINDAILYSDDHVFVTPDISPVAVGHYLIITKKHYCNFAISPKAVQKSLFKAMRYVYEKIFLLDCFIAFEHGSTNISYAGNSIDHAHLHIIKGNLSLKEAVEADRKYREKLDAISLQQYSANHAEDSYIWIMSADRVSTFYKANSLESQYLRKKVLELAPLNYTYNWRQEYSAKQSIDLYLHNLAMGRSAKL